MQDGKFHSPSTAARGAFTLVEMLIVISVLVALASLSVPIIGLVQERGRSTQSRATVDAMTAAIAAAGSRSVTVLVAGQLKSFRRFDVDGDGLLDADPQHGGLSSLGSADRDALIAQGYRGPVAELAPSIPKEAIDASGQVIDAWGRPLRIALLAGDTRLARQPARGADAVALWSAGADGIDDTEDDIRSWEVQ